MTDQTNDIANDDTAPSPAETTPAQTSAEAVSTPAAASLIASGGEKPPTAAPENSKVEWPENWRERLAEHASAGDKKAYDKEMRRLQRITDPSGVYGMYRELEGKFTAGDLIKVPGEKASDEERATFRKAMNVPEKPEGYLENLTLENGAVVGEADKPMLSEFIKAIHKTDARPETVKAALGWYYAQQERAAAEMDQADEQHRHESMRALKDEFGPSFDRRTNAIASVFASAPGGADVQNPASLFSRLLGGRTSDGRIIGNDPDVIRFMASLSQELNPEMTVISEGQSGGVSLDAEIKQIEGIMRTDRQRYNKEYAGRYSELLTVREKLQARGRA